MFFCIWYQVVNLQIMFLSFVVDTKWITLSRKCILVVTTTVAAVSLLIIIAVFTLKNISSKNNEYKVVESPIDTNEQENNTPVAASFGEYCLDQT